MSCKIDRERISAYALKLCDRKEADEVAVHVESCDTCKKELANLQQTAEVLDQAFNEEPPDWLMQKTLARLREQPQRSFPWFVWGIPVVSGVAIVLLFLLFYPGIRHKHPPVESLVRSAVSVENEQNGKYKNDERSSLFDIILDDMNIDMTDPINDRSIYESLDIAPDVARLLL